MKLRSLKTIISREYMTRVKKKSFLLTTFLVPVLLAAVCVLPAVMMTLAKEDLRQVAFIDESGLAKEHLVNNDFVAYKDYSAVPVDSMKSSFGKMKLDVLLVISPLDTATNTVTVSSYSEKPISVDVKKKFSEDVSAAVEDYRIAQYNVDDLKVIMEEVKVELPVSTYMVDEHGNEKLTSPEVYMWVSMILSMIIYMFITMFSGMVMQSVIEEKSSRIVEVLVSSVKATELMFGKILGVACVALTQFLLWVLLTGVLVGAYSALGGFEALIGNPQQVEQAASLGMHMGGDMSTLTSVVSQDDGMALILTTLQGIDWGMMIFAFVGYFILGYLLYASFFAAIGSAVENEADTNQLQMPVTVPLLLGFLISIYAFNAPNSELVWWGSMIPFTSPIVMLARIPFGVPLWEVLLSMGLLFGTFLACGWLSAKIYKIGILMFGKKTTFKDLWRWLRQK